MIHVHTHTHTHTQSIHTHTHTYTYTHTQYIPTYIHTYIQTSSHTFIQTYTDTHIFKRMHMHTHTHKRTHIYIYIRTYACSRKSYFVCTIPQTVQYIPRPFLHHGFTRRGCIRRSAAPRADALPPGYAWLPGAFTHTFTLPRCFTSVSFYRIYYKDWVVTVNSRCCPCH